MKIQSTTEVTYLTPKVPNYIHVEGKELAASVGSIDDETLEKIAAGWLVELKARAEQMRKDGI